MAAFQKFWMVLADRVLGEPTVRHSSLSRARCEAERLARTNPGVRFFVLEATGSCQSNAVTWDEACDAPF